MDISLIKPDQLTEAQLAAWREVAAADPGCDSPFYAPAFTQAVGQTRSDVEIAIVEKNRKQVAVFPFQRISGRTGRPVGWKINDYQGAIVAPGEELDAAELLRACRLSKWRFDHLPVTQAWCREAHTNVAESPVLDLSSGYECYLAERQAGGSSRIKTFLRLRRKLERDQGSLRFEFDRQDSTVLETLLRWKSEQLRNARSSNTFAQRWASQTLEILHRSHAPDCSGTLSALYCGSVLVAAHFGIRTERTLHWWLTAYNQDFDRYSPGSILLLQLAEECARRGIRRIDLGKGSEPYKAWFATSAIPLAEGCCATSSWLQTHERLVYRTTQSLRSSPWIYPAWKWMKQFRSPLAPQ